jgi:hypothetical protein
MERNAFDRCGLRVVRFLMVLNLRKSFCQAESVTTTVLELSKRQAGPPAGDAQAGILDYSESSGVPLYNTLGQ